MMRNIGIPDTPIDPEVVALAQQYGNRRESLLAIFQVLQAKRGGLTDKIISDVARVLHLTPAQAYGVASFYTMLSTHIEAPHTIRLCDGPPCWLRGAAHIRATLEATREQGWAVTRTSCLGLCDRAPAALVDMQPCGPLTPERVPDIWEGWRGDMPTYQQPLPGEVRVLLAHAGVIDPFSLDSALSHEAYQGLQHALQQSAEGVLREVEASGVRGRSGAGFPVGRKWRIVAQQQHTPTYVVCNADESEPGVFKDRVLMETNPHQLLEGMAIAAYAVGAREGFIYIRGEYAVQAAALEHAIFQAEARGYLGEHLLGTTFSLRIRVHRGAGAYICGEETALLESLQGQPWRAARTPALSEHQWL